MQAIKTQLISSLLKSLVSSTSDYEMIYKSLTRLPQIQIITNYFINYFSKTQEIETKKKIILLYFRYINEKQDQISNLNGSILFDHFKHIICETPLLDLIDEYILFSSILTFYIKNLKTFSDSSLYQSIIDWSNDNTSIALFSLSEVYDNYFGRCLSNIISNYNQKMPTIMSISLLLSKHKFESIDQTAVDFFNEHNVISTIRETIQYCFNQNQNGNNSNIIENERLGFFLIESTFHFLKETDSRQFYISISDSIFSIFDKCDSSIQNAALKAFCELPVIDEDEKISVTKQLSTVISAFGNRINDYDSDLANNLIEFTDKRIKKEEINLKETILPLFSVNEQLNGAALLACRYELVRDFHDYIFPETIKNSSQILSACYSIEYLNSHKKLSEKVISLNSIKTFLSAASIQNNGNNEYEKEISFAFDILIQIFKFEDVVKTVFENIFLLINSSMIDKIIDIFMKFCKENLKEFSNIQKVSNEEFIERLFPYLMKFTISPVESQFYISYLFILIFLNAMKTGDFKAICDFIDAPLSLVFEELIPSECQTNILNKALEIYNSYEVDIKDSLEKNETKLDDLNNLNMNEKDFQSSASLIIISFKCCDNQEIQINVAKSFINKDTFNELLFERFFASIAYIKSDESIEFFASIVLNKDDQNDNNNSLTSFFLKKSPFLKSFFFQQSGFSTKFSQQSIINTLSYISSLKMSSSSLSKLFSIFNETYELNTKSRSVLLSLSKQHIKCELSEKLIQFVISSDYFVEVIPDFLYVIDQINESILQKAFKTYFDYGDQNNFDQFCKSSFENYNNDNCFSVLSSSLLQFRDVYKMMKFGICLSKFDSKNSEVVPKLTIQFVMNILSNDDQLRLLCQKCLHVLYLLKIHINWNWDNEEEFNKQNFESTIQITSLPFNESVLKTCEFFDEITNTDLFNQYSGSIIEIICGISPIELPIAILALSICKKKFETKNFLLYLTNEGTNNSNNALIKHLINQALLESINHDFNKFMNSIVSTDMSNQFTRNFISFQMKSNEKHHELLLKFALSQFLTNSSTYLSDSDIEKGKFQLFLILCESNTFIVDSKSSNSICKKDDFLLIWLASIVLVNMNRSSKQISMIVRRDGRLGLSDSFKLVFGRLNFECPSLDDRDISLAETFSKKIAQFVFSLTLSNISGFIESLNEIDLKKGALSDITIVIIFILSDLLKFFIQIERKTDNNFVSILTDLIYRLCTTLKDDACRVVSAKFASLFTINNLQLFSDEGKKNLLLVSLRSLITPEAATQNSCIIFLSMILAVCPSESIIQQKSKLLDAITRCFDLKKIVGIEILLDSIQSIISIDPDVEPFNNMGLISIPWFLILSVNERELIRKKSSKILLDLSSSSSKNSQSDDFDVNNCYSQIVNGFIQKLGEDVMIVFGNFLIDWSSKNGFNVFSMKLIYQITVAIKKNGNKNSIEKILNKVVQTLMPVVNDSNSRLQAFAIEILSVLME